MCSGVSRFCRGLPTNTPWSTVSSIRTVCHREQFRRSTRNSGWQFDVRVYSISSKGRPKKEDRRSDSSSIESCNARNDSTAFLDTGEVKLRIEEAKPQVQRQITKKAGTKAAEQTVGVEKTATNVPPKRIANEVSTDAARTAGVVRSAASRTVPAYVDQRLTKVAAREVVKRERELEAIAPRSMPHAMVGTSDKVAESAAVKATVKKALKRSAGRSADHAEGATRVGARATKSAAKKGVEHVSTAPEMIWSKIKRSLFAMDHAGEASARHGAERVATKVGGHAPESATEKTWEHTSTLIKKMRKKPIGSSLKASDKVAESAAVKATRRSVDHAEGVARVGANATKSAAGKGVEHVSTLPETIWSKIKGSLFAVDHAGEASACHGAERVVSKVGGHAPESATEKTFEHTSTLLKKMKKKSIGGSLKASEISESAAVKATVKNALKSGPRRSVDHAEGAARVVANATKSAAGKGVEHVSTAPETVWSKIKGSLFAVDHAGEASARHGAERVASDVGGHAAESVTERTFKHTSTLLRRMKRKPTRSTLKEVDDVVEKMGQKAAKELTSKSGTRAAESMTERSLEGAPNRLSKVLEKLNVPIGIRLGRRTLIALPLLGGVLAGHICIQDYKRSLVELNIVPPNKDAALRFRLAACCDAIDACAHCYLFMGMYHGWDHDIMLLGEYVSLGAAAASIAFAIHGELLAKNHQLHIHRRTKPPI